jgi:hypothetical protein
MIEFHVGGYFSSDPADTDVAIVPVGPELLPRFQGLNFIRESFFELDPIMQPSPEDKLDYVVFGYPGSNSKFRRDRARRHIDQYPFMHHTRTAPAEVAAKVAARERIALDDHLVLTFDRKKTFVGGKRHNPSRPHGLSGGAAFHVVAGQIRLAGIMTEVHDGDRVMVAVRVGEVMRLARFAVDHGGQ